MSETYLFVRFAGMILLGVILVLVVMYKKSRHQSKQDLLDSEILYKPYQTEIPVPFGKIQNQNVSQEDKSLYPETIVAESISKVLEIAKERGKEFLYGPPASTASIQVLENTLGYPLPDDYKEFLATYGFMAYGDSGIEGILDDDPLSDWRGNIWFSTKDLRDNVKNLPGNCFPIEVHEDGAWCLEISLASESPIYRIINCEWGYSGGGETVAKSFNEFFIEWFLEQSLDSKIEIRPSNIQS